MRTLTLLLVSTLAPAAVMAKDTIESISEQIVFSGKPGDRKVFGVDAKTLLNVGAQFPREIAELKKDNATIDLVQIDVLPDGSTPSEYFGETRIRIFSSTLSCPPMRCPPANKTRYKVLTVIERNSCLHAPDDSPCHTRLTSRGITTEERPTFKFDQVVD